MQPALPCNHSTSRPGGAGALSPPPLPPPPLPASPAPGPPRPAFPPPPLCGSRPQRPSTAGDSRTPPCRTAAAGCRPLEGGGGVQVPRKRRPDAPGPRCGANPGSSCTWVDQMGVWGSGVGDTVTSGVSLGRRTSRLGCPPPSPGPFGERRGALRQRTILPVMRISVPGRGGLEQVLGPGAPEPTYLCLGDELTEGLLDTRQARTSRESACGDSMRYSQTSGNPGLLNLYLVLMRAMGRKLLQTRGQQQMAVLPLVSPGSPVSAFSALFCSS